MSRPLIGITTSLSAGERPRQLLDCFYVDAVEAAGGCPVPIAMTTDLEALRPILERLDGLVMTGGPAISDGLIGTLPGDIDPTPTRRYDADRATFDEVRQRQRPILGICYGMQFMNARDGGTISADLQTHFGVGPHTPSRNDGNKILHEILVEPDSQLEAALGAGRPRVNSYHIQSVVDVAPHLRITARSEDGIIEALESKDGSVLGVQFHPELMGEDGAGLFRQLVERSKNRSF